MDKSIITFLVLCAFLLSSCIPLFWEDDQEEDLLEDSGPGAIDADTYNPTEDYLPLTDEERALLDDSY